MGVKPHRGFESRPLRPPRSPVRCRHRRERGNGATLRPHAMASNEKPTVEIPADTPPSYQLELEDIEVGEGEEAATGRIVDVHYVGVSWTNGKQFDASWDRGKPFSFGLGKGQVISGWDQGVAGMKVGGL